MFGNSVKSIRSGKIQAVVLGLYRRRKTPNTQVNSGFAGGISSTHVSSARVAR
jgi:hypothetical protein